MTRVSALVRRERPLTLLREAIWRSQKHWKQLRFSAAVGRDGCPVQYVSAGYYRPALEELGADSREAMIQYAGSVAKGRFPRFGHAPMPLGSPPNWHLDFVSGKDWPMVSSEAIPFMRMDGSDVKAPWELSRLQFLPVLGKAWHLTGDGRLRDSAKLLLSDWMARNPVRVGVNWTIAMEAALRGISICLLLELLAPFAPEEQPWLAAVTRSLWEHLLFIEAHNEFSHFARSNHYLSNVVGLLCLSSYLEGPGMQARRWRYSELVQREIAQQTYSDGGDSEASTGYHFLKTQMFTLSLLLMRARALPPSPEFLNALTAMYRFMAALADSQGRLPHVGDCDDGRVELLSDDTKQMVSQSPEQHDSLSVSGQLGVGSHLLNENFGGHAQDAAWYGFGAPVPQSRPRPLSEVFPVSGVGVARREGAEVLFFAMPNGIAGKGSHTHNDKLSVVVRIAGEELFSDCGTCCYSREPGKRNLFRATGSHNTVRVDGQEQNGFSQNGDSIFRMRDDAKVSRIESDGAADAPAFRAEHTGYRELEVVHGRRVRLLSTSVLIEDTLVGRGEHSIEAHWHVPKVWRVDILVNRGREVRCSIQGARSLLVKFTAMVDLTLGRSLGKMSRAFGLESDSTTLTVCARSAMPFSLETRVDWRE